MGRIVAWVQAFALGLGAPGLLIITFLDSSFLTLPEIADLLVVWMVTMHKTRFVAYVLSAVVGSVAGCLTLYYIGRKGGDAVVRRWFDPARVERARAAVQQYGMLAVLIPSMLPPPAPFKVFVLLAGVANIGVARFAAAIAIGRGARYFIAGLLALWYGDRALEFMHEHARTVSLVLVLLLGAGLAGYVLWGQARAANHR